MVKVAEGLSNGADLDVLPEIFSHSKIEIATFSTQSCVEIGAGKIDFLEIREARRGRR